MSPANPSLLPARTEDGRRVTRCFLFTDIENSTAVWERVGEPFSVALDLHHTVVRAEIARHGGEELQEAGDGFLVAFIEPQTALRCAIAVQQALDLCRWPAETGTLRVRMGLHVGEVQPKTTGGYRGLTLHRGARRKRRPWRADRLFLRRRQPRIRR